MSKGIITSLDTADEVAREYEPNEVPEAAKPVIDTLLRTNVPFTLKVLAPRAYSLAALAAACQCRLSEIAQTSVYRGMASRKPCLVIHPASGRVDERILSAMVGENMHRAEVEWAQKLTGYAVEIMPPVGHRVRTPVLMDGALTRYGRVWCHTGAPNAMLLLPTVALARVMAARIIRFEPQKF